MPIQVTCQCGKTLTAPDAYAGREGKCKACGARIRIPKLAAAAVHPEQSSRQPIPEPVAKGVDRDFPPALGPDPDEVLYHASPSMVRNHPIWFFVLCSLLGLSCLGTAIGLLRERSQDALMAALVLPSVFGLPLGIWYIKARTTQLTITPRKISLQRGWLSRSFDEVRVADVRNVKVHQGFFQRMFGVGWVGISSAGQSDIEISVSGMPHPKRIRDIIDRCRG